MVSGGSFVFGWAKPVPYDPRFLKHPVQGAGLIAAVGPLSNFFIAAVFGLVIRFAGPFFLAAQLTDLLSLFHLIVFVNVLLAIFNLLPLPPLDGSKVLFAFLPARYDEVRRFLERYGFTLLLLFIFFGFGAIRPLIEFVYSTFVGS
jgi:Zn-dependent protease